MTMPTYKIINWYSFYSFKALLVLLVFSIVALGASISNEFIVPVIYVCFGTIPMYLKINIEIAARKNPVIVIADSFIESNNEGNYRSIRFELISQYMLSANSFKNIYKHISKDRRYRAE